MRRFEEQGRRGSGFVEGHVCAQNVVSLETLQLDLANLQTLGS